MQKVLKSVRETEELAEKLAKYIVAGDVIRLTGDLGVGKSVFARSMIKALGHQGKHIPSPTFTLMQTYDDTRLPISHIDLYRMGSPDEVEALSITSWLEHGVVLVEWPEKAPQWFPEEKPDLLDFHIMEMDNSGTLTVLIEEGENGERIATLEGGGPSWSRRLSLVEGRYDRPVNEKERQKFVDGCGYKNHVVSPVSADASFRTYWRIHTPEGNRIIMDSPPPVENVRPVIEMTNYLEGIGIHVPHIYQKDIADGYLLLEDFGDTTVRNGIVNKDKPLEPWYYQAVDVLTHIAKSPLPSIREYSKKALWSEVSRFVDWYLPYARGHATHTADRRAFRELWEPLFDKILDVPQTTVLWDYHADNLMMLTEDAPKGLKDIGVIDFQDARVGPLTYDMSMLLQDVRFEISKEFENKLINYFILGMGGSVTHEQFMQSYRLINLQRTLKIIGGFTRLYHRDGKEAYLQYLPRCWRIVDEALMAPECREIQNFMNKMVPAKRCLSA